MAILQVVRPAGKSAKKELTIPYGISGRQILALGGLDMVNGV